eukprot:scaffold103510_cov18-Tisochrysis_lutea.AAC.1
MGAGVWLRPHARVPPCEWTGAVCYRQVSAFRSSRSAVFATDYGAVCYRTMSVSKRSAVFYKRVSALGSSCLECVMRAICGR